MEITPSYDGDDVIDGLRCHRLKVFYNEDRWKDDQGPAVRFLWVAPERNYLPIRSESHARGTRRPGGSPLRLGRAEDLREISPGVWFPFRVIRDNNMPRIDPEIGKRKVANREVLTFQKAELDPHYDISLFRDIPFPDGAFVYEIENDKIVRKYVKGGQNVIRPKSNFALYVFAAGLTLTGAISLFWVARRRRSNRTHLVAS